MNTIYSNNDVTITIEAVDTYEAKVNMLREFGEFLPNYEEIMRDRKQAKKPFLYPVHQEPNLDLPF